LNFYSWQGRAFDDTDRDVAVLLATHASLALAGTYAVTTAELREEQLQKAIDSRDVIGQAKGILMARRGITSDEAFDILRKTSQELNVKLVDLAQTLTTRHRDLDTPEATR
jgi:AmiR/NasT family two-component response regulator